MRDLKEINRLREIQFRCFLTDDDKRWLDLEQHLNNFFQFEEYIMKKYNLDINEANRYISDYIIENIDTNMNSSLSDRLYKVDKIKVLLSLFTMKEGFNIKKSIEYLYNFQEKEKVIIMPIVFGQREELLYL